MDDEDLIAMPLTPPPPFNCTETESEAATVLADRSTVIVTMRRIKADGDGHTYGCPQWGYNWRGHDYATPGPKCSCKP